MRIVLQRVSAASVTSEGYELARIGRGLLLLVGIERGDTGDELRFWARKVPELRIFPDAHGKMNLSVREVGGELLCVPQFTLFGDCEHGRRPEFTTAAPPAEAAALYSEFLGFLAAEGGPVKSGVFGARMEVSLVNDGPVTLILERAKAQWGPS